MTHAGGSAASIESAATPTPTARTGALRVAMVLAAAVVVAQISYPNVLGSDRDALTLLTVGLFAGASLVHAGATRGVAAATKVLAVFGGGGLLVEALGVATGVPFGTYAYDLSRLGPSVAEVPLLIPAAWTMLGWPAAVVARRITSSRIAGPAVAAFALAAWDLFLDPQMVAEGYWSWSGDGPHLIGTIPATNYLGWVITAYVMMLLLWRLGLPGVGEDDQVPIALYVWTWAGSTVAHALFLGLPQSALYGGVGMGLVVIALWRTRGGARP